MKKPLKESLGKVSGAVESASEVIILTHTLPDGDAIGSVLGLALILRKSGKKAIAAWADKSVVPAQYSFLPGQEYLKNPADLPERPRLVIAVDCGAPDRLGAAAEILQKSTTSINIDHHRNNRGFADINVVYPGYASAAEIVYELSAVLGVDVDKDIALNIYTGIVTDTGRFQYSNTTENSFLVAAKMVRIGVDPVKVFRNVYEGMSLAKLKLAGRAFEKVIFDEESGLICTVITGEDYKAAGAGISDTENLIDSLRSVENVKVAAVFKETTGRLRVSLRSTGKIDVGEIAESKGGGGHRLAAGYNTNKTPEKAIEELRTIVLEAAK